MILADLETLVRQDLFDPAGSANQRWSTADIDRAIDKAVDRYSQYYPNIVYTDMATQPYQRTYPYPLSWNSTYPIWWLERILYPLQLYASGFPAPTGAPDAATTTGTTLGIGNYRYVVTWLTPGGESTPSPQAVVTTTLNNQSVVLSSLPTYSGSTTVSGNATNRIIGRNIYRTQVGGATFYLVTTLADTSTTSYTDTIADAALTNRAQPPAVNTTGIMLWPPCEREFAEYSNLFDSTTALATGGNMGSQGGIGTGQGPTGSMTPGFTLKLTTAELPKDSTLVMRIFYATKHQLDSNGSTLPEAHRDIIVLGASLYAMEAYQIATNDNFEFQDGSLHDRIDDSKIPYAWLAAIQAKRQAFEARLQEVKKQRDFAYGARVHWGGVPLHWGRL